MAKITYRALLVIPFFLSAFDLVSCSECLTTSLQKSQDCSNKKFLYFMTEGVSSGFGSEFNYYFVHALLRGICENRRIVFVRSKRDWPYDCPSKSGWACYLDFPCPDSVIEFSAIEFSADNVIHQQHGRNQDINQIKRDIKGLYESNSWGTSCDIHQATTTEITSIAAVYLYKLNNSTRKSVEEFNSAYNLSSDHSYIAAQIRATDKRSEMDDESWAFMNNVTAIAEYIKPYLIDKNINNLFISTDNCTVVSVFRLIFDKSLFRIYSACDDSRAHGDPHRGTYEQTLRLIAEIDMLVKGRYFFGLIHSNLVRMVYRLRYFNNMQQSFVPFAQHSKQYQSDHNLQLTNLIT